MQKPNGYDEARATGERTPITLGGHYCIVKQVTETVNKDNKPMIVVLFDFCTPDPQNGMFTGIFTNDDRPEKKWPFSGSKYIMVNDFIDPSKTSRQFKTFCSCIEKSNNYEITWGGGSWGKQFVGKKIGAVYGEEENEYNGRRFMRETVKYFCKWDAVEKQPVPAPKYLQDAAPIPARPAPVPDAEGFLNAADALDDELPF